MDAIPLFLFYMLSFFYIKWLKPKNNCTFVIYTRCVVGTFLFKECDSIPFGSKN